MAQYQTKQLSTPKVLVDGVVVAIVPNSCTVKVPGDAKVRAMSAGGGSIEVVIGLDAASLIGHVRFELPATAQNADRVRAWKERMRQGLGMTILVVEDGIQFPHQSMQLTKDTDIHMRADGNITCDFEGDPQF